MVHMPVSEFKNSIGEILNQVAYAGERVFLQRRGKDIAAIVSISDLKTLKEIEAMENKIDLEKAQEALKELRDGKDTTVSWEDARKILRLK